MREQTVTMYCLVDDLLTLTRPVRPLAADARCRLTNAQVLATALVAARFFGGNLTLARHHMEQHWGQNRSDKSGFTHRLHTLIDTLLTLFATCGQVLKTCTPRPATSLTRLLWPCIKIFEFYIVCS